MRRFGDKCGGSGWMRRSGGVSLTRVADECNENSLMRQGCGCGAGVLRLRLLGSLRERPSFAQGGRPKAHERGGGGSLRMTTREEEMGKLREDDVGITDADLGHGYTAPTNRETLSCYWFGVLFGSTGVPRERWVSTAKK